MGTKLKDIAVSHPVDFAALQGKVIVIDAFNALYQFLASIRQRDGTPLMDSKNRVTSHLSGLFSRTAKLMQHGIRVGYVFDGAPPALKKKERERRAELKAEALTQYEAAKGREDIDAMRKFAMRTSKLSREMVAEAKALVEAMGLPVVQAPSEGEAQAAALVKEGKAYAEASQDYDCLLFGVPTLIRNLTVSEKRKLPGQYKFVNVTPEQLFLKENLKELGITQKQLVALGMLIGTDYNYGGIKGIGPKHGLKLVKKHGENFAAMFTEAKWSEHFDMEWEEVMDTISNMPVEEGVDLSWSPPNHAKIIKLLCDEHDFSVDRIEGTLDKLQEAQSSQQQKGLSEFF